MTNRRNILIALVLVLAALVVADRSGVLNRDVQADSGSLRAQYLQAAELARKQSALLETRDGWRSADALAKERWDELAERVIVRQSEEIAQGTLRERLTQLAQEAGVPRPESRPLSALPAEEGDAIRVIGLSLDIRTGEWERAYRLIDRIETDPRMIATVTHVTLDGPGLAQIERELRMTLTVRAIAMVAPDGEGSL